MGGPDATPDLWKQPFSAVRASVGYPGNDLTLYFFITIHRSISLCRSHYMTASFSADLSRPHLSHSKSLSIYFDLSRASSLYIYLASSTSTFLYSLCLHLYFASYLISRSTSMSPDNSLSLDISLSLDFTWSLSIHISISRSLSPYFTIPWCHRDLTLTILVTLGISPPRYLWFFYLSSLLSLELAPSS